jgi:hypothetical protein
MWIIFIEIGWTFPRTFDAARELGLKILLLSHSEQNIECLKGKYDLADKLNSQDYDSIYCQVHALIGNETIAAFWTLKDFLTPVVARLNESLGGGVQYVSKDILAITRNKYEMRKKLVGTQYNPEFLLVRDGKLPIRPFSGKEIVVKPIAGWGSIGVERVGVNEEFQDAVYRCRSSVSQLINGYDQLQQFQGYELSQSILVEEYIEGEEFSVDVFARAGEFRIIGICSKLPMLKPYFEEISYCMPADIPRECASRLGLASKEVLSRLGVNTGMAHLEFRVNDKRIILLEVNLRIGGGGLTNDLVWISSGMDIVKAVLAEMCCLPSSQYLKSQKNDIALLFLLQCEQGGIVKTLPNIPNLPSAVRMIKYQKISKPGDIISGYPCCSGLPGFVLFHIPGHNSDSYKIANHTLDLCFKQMHILYKDRKEKVYEK